MMSTASTGFTGSWRRCALDRIRDQSWRVACDHSGHRLSCPCRHAAANCMLENPEWTIQHEGRSGAKPWFDRRCPHLTCSDFDHGCIARCIADTVLCMSSCTVSNWRYFLAAWRAGNVRPFTECAVILVLAS